jgi:GNAT superfamily N-acetyltransferase
MNDSNTFSWKPVTSDNFFNLETLFGGRGGRDGCWCMRWRLPRERFESCKGDDNRRTLESGIANGKIHGVIGYINNIPIAWCSLGDRYEFRELGISELLAPVDDQPVWAITCLFIAKAFRRKGISDSLLAAAVEYAKEKGAKIVEGYPLSPITPKVPVAAAWTGLESVFIRGGFIEVARRVPMRPIYRLEI